MRYNIEDEKIYISLKEFVSIARRGISPTLPYDDEEPSVKGASRRERKVILNEDNAFLLKYEFSFNGNNFVLYGEGDNIEGNRLTLIRFIDYSPMKLKKQDEKEIRGEGFVLAKMLIEKEKFSVMSLDIIYINENDGEKFEKEEILDKETIDKFFEKCVCAVSLYSKPEVERVTERLPSMRKMRFPYAHARDGQRDFVNQVYRTLAKGSTLLACAPTGTGKTISTIYPAIRALGDGRVEKIFYLTPKTTTSEAAKDCLNLLCENGAKIKGIILTAKEKNCQNGLLCRENRRMCPNSTCNKLPDATLYLYSKGKAVIDKNDIAEAAKSYTVCPYELELAYAELCDVVICDFNYLFDPSVYIRRFFDVGGEFAFLIDEAHNLSDRAREMYSIEISNDDFDAILENPTIGEHSLLRKEIIKKKQQYLDTLLPYLEENMREDRNGEKSSATHLKEVPSEIYSIFEGLLASADDELQNAFRAKDEEKNARIRVIRNFFYKMKKTNFILNRFDDCYIMFLFLEKGKITMKLFNIDTGNVIRQRLEKGKGTVFFSATLEPLDYYRSVLGADRSSDTIEVRSPFDPEQLSVSIMDKISTRYSERDRTIPAVCRVIAATLSAKRGNYMVFAPSFEYAESLSKVFSSIYPKIKVLTQRKNMTQSEKSNFLKEFEKESSSYLVGFCVLGGIYSEGVDLVGDSLIGAVVVGIGMPSLSYEREAMAEYFEDKYESGKQFAYIYPGMNRVLQAAGRVIRHEDDRGVIVLIDDRFDDPIYKKGIPSLWEGMEYVSNPKALQSRLIEFWKKKDLEEKEKALRGK